MNKIKVIYNKTRTFITSTYNFFIIMTVSLNAFIETLFNTREKTFVIILHLFKPLQLVNRKP